MQAQEVRLKVLCVFDPRPLIDTWSSSLLKSEEACPQDLNVDVMQERRQLVFSVPGGGFSCADLRAPDTASRLCVRTVLCSSGLSSDPPLRSTGSAAAEAALFARFLATSGRSDFSIVLIVGYGLRASRRCPGHDWRGRRWRSHGSRAKGFCACQGLRRREVGMCLAISTPAVLPFLGRKTSAPRTCLTRLNTSGRPPL